MAKKSIPRICEQCGATFSVHPSQLKWRGAKFCSRACTMLSQTGQPVKRICPQCQNEVTVRASQVKNRRAKFCGMECYKAFTYPPLEQRFWSKVNRTATCWLWTGATDTCGYGVIVGKLEGKSKQHNTHRVSYVLTFGSIPTGLYVLHRCEKDYQPGDITYRRCVNPSHLYAGTHDDNMRDMAESGRVNNQYTV